MTFYHSFSNEIRFSKADNVISLMNENKKKLSIVARVKEVFPDFFYWKN